MNEALPRNSAGGNRLDERSGYGEAMNPGMPRGELPISNPFSTRYTCPAAVRYVFPPEVDSEWLIKKLGDSAWWGQIIGPHGSGKSTVLHTVAPALEKAGRASEIFVLQAGQWRLPVDRTQANSWDSRTQVIVDGYEQLSWFQRTWLRRKCRARRCGLLVTAHHSMGLPLLWQTATSPELAWQVVTQLLDPSNPGCISRGDVKEAYQDNAGDMRETLMALYDLFEQRRP